MISCYIIGELSTCKIIKEFVEDSHLLSLKGITASLHGNSATIGALRPDIVFVDASLIEKNKTALAAMSQFTAIIFIATKADEAYEAFEALGFDYLLLPLTAERFERSINKFINLSLAHKRSGRITESFFIRTDAKGQKELLVKCNEICYIEAFKNYVILHMVDGRELSCHNTMKEVEDSLVASHFIRVHKSFMINYEKVTAIEGNTLFLNGNEQNRILVGSTYRKAFFDLKNQKVIKKQKNYFQSLDYSTLVSLLALYTGLLNCFDLTDFIDLFYLNL